MFDVHLMNPYHFKSANTVFGYKTHAYTFCTVFDKIRFFIFPGGRADWRTGVPRALTPSGGSEEPFAPFHGAARALFESP